MLKDLDRTLEELLKRELPLDLVSSNAPDSLLPQVAISFVTPDSEFVNYVTPPAISLFLYDVRENLGLRSKEWSVERQSNGTAYQKRPPTRVDCSYLITAWPREKYDSQTEHYLLGEVMKVLLRYPEIPAEVLQGSLKTQQFPLRTVILRPSLLQSLGEFWQAIGGKPKPTLNYTVTIAVSVDEIGEPVPLVVDKQIFLKPSITQDSG